MNPVSRITGEGKPGVFKDGGLILIKRGGGGGEEIYDSVQCTTHTMGLNFRADIFPLY